MAEPPGWRARLAAWSQFPLPHHALTWLASRLSNARWPARPMIAAFRRLYRIDMADYERPPTGFACFDAFFTRALRPGTRPFPEQPDAIACPCDGSLSQLGEIRDGRIVQAKGREFTLAELLGDADRAARFVGGRFATIYLAPGDYHRVHSPIGGRLHHESRIPGRLFCVSAATAAAVDRLYARNERMVAMLETCHGPVAVVMVAALLVAGIETAWGGPRDLRPGRRARHRRIDPPIDLNRGDELGRFHWGSTVIVLTAARAPGWRDNLSPGQRVRLGQPLTQTRSSGSDA